MDGVDEDSGRLSRPRVPGYDSFELIGRGGFSTVWRARQIAYDRMVAVKILLAGIDDEAGRRRFERECTLMGRLTGHPNIVTVFDSGFLDDGHPFLAMTYCEHGSLADRVRSTGPIPAAEVTRIGIKIAGALDAAHQLGVLHRDVKPENILITAFGEPALADFGISTARGAATVTTAYTPTHAAPEVLLGKPADMRTDAYNLGSTLYQLLRGESAFSDPEQTGIAGFVDRVLHEQPPALDPAIAPPALSEAIQAAMAKDPADRPQTLADFGRRLQDVQRAAGEPVTDMVLMGPVSERIVTGSTAPATVIASSLATIPNVVGASPAAASGLAAGATILPPVFHAVGASPAGGDATMLAARSRQVETPSEPPPAAKPRKRHVRALVAVGAVVVLAALLVVVPWRQVMAMVGGGASVVATPSTSSTPTPSATSTSATPTPTPTPTPTATPTPTSTPTPTAAPSSAQASVSKPLISIYTRITKIIVIAPSPPPDLVATRSGAKVQLVWNKSPTATVASYKAIRAANGGAYGSFPYNELPVTNVTNCPGGYPYCLVDNSPPAGVALCYEIIAVGENGMSSAPSPKSCVAA